MTESRGAPSDFSLKTPVEVAMFLKDNGFGSDVCEAFEGRFRHGSYVYYLLLILNLSFLITH